MRILFVAAHFYPHMGGVEQYTQELSSRLQQRGHECRIATSDFGSPQQVDHVNGIPIEHLPSWGLFSGEYPVVKPWRATWRSYLKLARWRPELIVTNTRYFSIHLVFVVMSAWLKIPHIHIEHGSSTPMFAHSW